jgi:phosphatidylglycerol---prolipoprotein diacylglyceryl transferase
LYPTLFTLGEIGIRSSVVFLVLGIIAGILLGWREARRVGISDREFHLYWISAIPLALLFGVLNGLIFRVGFWNALDNLEHALSNGLVSFGAALGLLLWGYLLFSKLSKFKKPIGLVLDTISLILPLILGIYRIGCLLNGCCHGLETDSIFGIVLPGAFGIWAKRFPTQIMLMVFNFALFAWLWSRREKKAFEGSLTFSFLIIYSFGRLLIDSLRTLPRVLGPFSLHQLTSIAILLITIYIYFEYWMAKRSQSE